MIPYIIDSFRGGISDEVGKGPKGSFDYGENLDIHRRRDALYPGFKMMKVSDSRMSSLIKYTVNGPDGSTYAFCDNGAIWAIAGSQTDPVFNPVAGDPNGAIKGASKWTVYASDVLTSTYLVWCTNTCVARQYFPDNGEVDWAAMEANYKPLLTATDFHPMKAASGNMMIGNENFLAWIDYFDNFNYGALNLRPGNTIKCLDERDDYVIIGTINEDEAEEGFLWNWIITSQNWVQKKKIPVKGVNALIDTEQLLLQGGTNGEIFYSDFTNTAPVNTIPGGRGVVNSGAVTVENDLAIFAVYGTNTTYAYPGLYSYGRRSINRNPAFNLEHTLSVGDELSEIGTVWNNNGVLFASWKDATTYGVDMISSTTRATAYYYTHEINGGQPHLKKEFGSVKLTWPMATPAGISLRYLIDNDTTVGWIDAKTGAGDTTFTNTNATECEFIINKKGKTIQLEITITPSGTSAPEIDSVVIYIGDNPDLH